MRFIWRMVHSVNFVTDPAVHPPLSVCILLAQRYKERFTMMVSELLSLIEHSFGKGENWGSDP